MRLDKINKIYSDIYDTDADAFLDRLIEELGVSIEIKEEDLQKIPREGAFITISNHPFGGLDGIILIKLLSKIRPDYKVMANFLLKKIEPIKDYFLGVSNRMIYITNLATMFPPNQFRLSEAFRRSLDSIKFISICFRIVFSSNPSLFYNYIFHYVLPQFRIQSRYQSLLHHQ